MNRTIFATNCSNWCYFYLQEINYLENKRMVSCVFHLKYLSQYMVKLFVLKMSGPADFKSVPGFENWPRFGGVIEQNKICNSFCQYCIRMDRREITKSIVQILLFIIFFFLFGEPSYNDYMRRDVVMKESKSSVYTFPALTICLVWTI